MNIKSSDQAGIQQAGILKTDLGFVYRAHPGHADALTMVLLHGSGVDETTLVPLGREIVPDATLIAVRGRIMQDDSRRWFSKITPTSFVQKSIREEAAAFAVFVQEAARAEGFDPGRTVFLGYSNGANLLSSVMLLHPGLIRRIALLRAMPVLKDVPPTRLEGSRVIVVAGAQDATYGRFSPALVKLLSKHGAEVESHIVPSGHEFGSHDAEIVRKWLDHQPATS